MFTEGLYKVSWFVVQVTKQYEASNKDKEAMVMRYAVSEKEVIYQKGERELLEKKLREVTREKDMLLGKLKGASAEKARICQMLDVKVTSRFILISRSFHMTLSRTLITHLL